MVPPCGKNKNETQSPVPLTDILLTRERTIISLRNSSVRPVLHHMLQARSWNVWNLFLSSSPVGSSDREYASAVYLINETRQFWDLSCLLFQSSFGLGWGLSLENEGNFPISRKSRLLSSKFLPVAPTFSEKLRQIHPKKIPSNHKCTFWNSSRR